MHRPPRERTPLDRPSAARHPFFRRPPSRRVIVLAAAALCPIVMSGCNLFMIAAYLIAGPPSVEPDFEVATRTSLTDEDVTIAVACYVPTDLRADLGNEKLDRDLARLVTGRLVLNKMQVREVDAVRRWLDLNPDWDDPGEIAEAMQVTHVILIDVSRFSLWEENSASLMRGRADAIVTVYHAPDGGDAEEIYNRPVAVKYPLAVPRDSSSQNPGKFRQEFLGHLSERIGWLFYPHYNGDGMDRIH
jgi:hypothetical protein